MIRKITLLVIGLMVCVAGFAYAQEAKDFTLSSLSGESVSLSSFLGKQNVLLVFGTTWCPYCVKEVPDLNVLYEKYDSNALKILSIDVNEPQAKVQRFSEKKGVKYTVLLDTTGSVARDYGVRGIPDNILVNKDGEVVYRGHLDVKKIESLIQ